MPQDPSPAVSTWFVPGRIEVFGKHTDYAGGNVLVGAVDRGVTVTAQPTSLLIGVALAIADLNGLPESTTWRETIRTDLDLAAYLASVENGSSFRHLSGGSGVGTNGGSEDHAAILTGIPGHLLHYNFDPMKLDATVKVPDDWAFVVATSGVAAEKTGSALHDYNRCSSEVRQILTLARQRHNLEYANLHAMLRDNGDEWAQNLVSDSPSLTRRMNHFLIESQQVVPEAVQAFRERDQGRLGAIALRSQQAARDLLGNQLPETSQLVQSAIAAGAFAASSFGAGFGGSVWALVNADSAGDFTDSWLQHYRTALPEAGARAIALNIRASGPARRCG